MMNYFKGIHLLGQVSTCSQWYMKSIRVDEYLQYVNVYVIGNTQLWILGSTTVERKEEIWQRKLYYKKKLGHRNKTSCKYTILSIKIMFSGTKCFGENHQTQYTCSDCIWSTTTAITITTNKTTRKTTTTTTTAIATATTGILQS